MGTTLTTPTFQIFPKLLYLGVHFCLGEEGVHLQLIPVNYANFFLALGGARAPSAAPGYANEQPANVFCDLDLDSMTHIYEHELKISKKYLLTKSELGQRLQHYGHTGTQTDATECITTTYSPAVLKTHSRN